MTLMLFLKLLTGVAAIGLLLQLFQLGTLGRGLKMVRTKKRIEEHRKAVSRVGWLTAIAVVLIEAQVRLSPEPYAATGALFVFHLAIVVMMVAVFLMIILKYTGLKAPGVHSRLAYSFFGLFTVALITGSVMLYRLPT